MHLRSEETSLDIREGIGNAGRKTGRLSASKGTAGRLG
jgi:hypothetical protein